MNDKQHTGSQFYLIGICLVTTIGGFLFGYDTAVISGAVEMITKQFELTPDMTGWVVSSTLLGAIIGSASSGILADRFGRKPVLVFCSFLLLISAIGSMLPQRAMHLVIARMIGGFGVGITALASPMYMSEIAPARFRGRMVALYQFAITLGIVCSFAVNAFLLSRAGLNAGETGGGFLHLAFTTEVWRSMFGAEIIPAIAYFLLLFVVPESPRWLIKRGLVDRAKRIMNRVMPEENVAKIVTDVRDVVSHESNSVFELFKPGLRMALILGILLPLFSQLSGINVIMYYGPTILKSVGFAIGGAMGGAILIGIINCLFTMLAIWKVDSFGRRPLLLAGVSGTMITLAACAILFRMPNIPNIVKLIPLLAYCAFFSFSYGPICWIVIGEIFPTRYRGRAVSIGTCVIWTGAFTVSQAFPRMLAELGPSGVFAVFAVLMMLAIIYLWKYLPETKGRSLEDIERSWTCDTQESNPFKKIP